MSSGMISRVADHCMWMGRYLERAESTSRLLQATRGLVLDTDLTPEECWRPLLVAAGEEPAFLLKFGEQATADAETVEQYMTWSEPNLSSVVNSVRGARENARSIREVVSLDAWESINELYIWLQSDESHETYAVHRYGFHRKVGASIQLTLGLLRSTMLHDTPLDFIWLGVMLERADQTARLLDVHHRPGMPLRHPVVEMSVWVSLLRAVSAMEPFLQRYRGKVSAQTAAAFLMLDGSLPRSLRYCIGDALQKLRRVRPADAPSVARLGALHAWIQTLQTTTLEARVVHDHLTRIVDEISVVCTAVGEELFGATPAATPVVEQRQA